MCFGELFLLLYTYSCAILFSCCSTARRYYICAICVLFWIFFFVRLFALKLTQLSDVFRWILPPTRLFIAISIICFHFDAKLYGWKFLVLACQRKMLNKMFINKLIDAHSSTMNQLNTLYTRIFESKKNFQKYDFF